MENILSEPTAEVLQCVEILESAISRYLQVRDNTIKGWGKYESEAESIVLFGLIIRQIESVCVLAKTDLILIPGALTLARSVFETSVRIIWMLYPDDPFDRELRWLVHLKNDEKYFERLIKRFGAMEKFDGIDELMKSFETQRSTSRAFRLDVESVLPNGYTPLKELPNFDSMLVSIQHSSQYIRYIELSQFSHGTHMAGRLNRKDFGTEMKLDEFGKFADWWFVFNTCFDSFVFAGARILEVLGGNYEEFANQNWINSGRANIEKLKIMGNEPLIK